MSSNSGSIPCYLTNRDCLTTVKGMVEHLSRCSRVGKITVVDNASTYQPLLDYYNSADFKAIASVKICENIGPQASWQGRQHVSDYYFVSDADLDISAVPLDFLELLQDGLDSHEDVIKAGLSLRIDDLPDHSPLKPKVLDVESKYWSDRRNERWWNAPIDTTAALYRDSREWGGYGPAIRADKPYEAVHVAWYLKPGEIPADWQHYFNNLSKQGIVWGALMQDRAGQQK